MPNVTIKDVYEIVSRVEDKLDRVDGRVSALEIWRAEIVGKLTVIVTVMMFAVSVLVDWVKRKLNLS